MHNGRFQLVCRNHLADGCMTGAHSSKGPITTHTCMHVEPVDLRQAVPTVYLIPPLVGPTQYKRGGMRIREVIARNKGLESTSITPQHTTA